MSFGQESFEGILWKQKGQTETHFSGGLPVLTDTIPKCAPGTRLGTIDVDPGPRNLVGCWGRARKSEVFLFFLFTFDAHLSRVEPAYGSHFAQLGHKGSSRYGVLYF